MISIIFIFTTFFFPLVLKHILKCKNVNYSPALHLTDEKMKTKKAQKVKRDQLTADSLIIWMLFFSCGMGKYCLFTYGASCFRRDTEPRAIQTPDVASAALEKMSVF